MPQAEHVLYKNRDKDAPESIKDANGDVVLGLCRVCGKGERDLQEPCKPQAEPRECRSCGRYLTPDETGACNLCVAREPQVEPLSEVIEKALLRVAENVAKHTIQRAGWEPNDKCFQVDLRQSQAEIVALFNRLRQENEDLQDRADDLFNRNCQLTEEKEALRQRIEDLENTAWEKSE